MKRRYDYRDRTSGKYRKKKRTLTPALLVFIVIALVVFGNIYSAHKGSIVYFDRNSPTVVMKQNASVIETTAPHDMIEVVDYAMELADEYGVSYELVEYIISNESGWYPYAIGDLHIQGNDGKAITSRGLLQISRYYWPEITNKQAFDPYFSIKWAMPKIAKRETCEKLWTTCRNYYKHRDLAQQ